MAQQTFSRGAVLPNVMSTGAPGLGTLVIDAANEVCAFICKAPKTGNIRSIWYRSTVTIGATIRVGIYQVSLTTGNPSDVPTAWATDTFVDQAITTGDTTDFINSGAFTADAAVVKGDLVAICWIQPAASAGNMALNTYNQSLARFPYASLFTGTWAKSGAPVICMIEYSDGSVEIPLGGYAFGDAAAGAMPLSTTIGSGSTPDVWGARTSWPGPVRINGMWLLCDADGDFNIKIVTSAWDGATSGLLATAFFDASVRAATTAGLHWVEFDTAVDVDANTVIRALVEPSSATTMVVYAYSCVNAAHFGAQPLAGANFHLTTAKDPNDDTDFTNYNNGTDGYRIPFMGFVLDGISDGVSAGGGGRYGVIGSGF